jgi:hypothetical protein
MDKFWSICCVPIGVMLGFAPPIILWLISEFKGESKDQAAEKNKSEH